MTEPTAMIITAAESVTRTANAHGPEKGVEHAILLLNAQSSVNKHYRRGVEILRQIVEAEESGDATSMETALLDAAAFFDQEKAGE